ncbi:MAG: hypothetical protein ACRD1T_01905, partial [Acidimicrobiia bacterium]
SLGGGTTAIVRILDDDPRPASSSTSATRSDRPIPSAPSSASQRRFNTGSTGAEVSNETSQPTSEDTAAEEGAVTVQETPPSESTAPAASGGAAAGISPVIPLVALGSLLGVGGSVFWVVRRRNAQTDRR